MSGQGARGGDGGGAVIFGLDRRKILVTAVVGVFLVVAAFTVAGRLGDWESIRRRLGRAEEGWLLVAVSGLVLAYAGNVLAYREIARSLSGPPLGYRTSTRVVVVGLGAAVLGSAPGGLAVDFWALHRAGAGLHDAASRVIALHTLRWGAVGVFASAAGAAALLVGGAPSGMALGWLLAVPLAVAASVPLGTPAWRDRIAPGDRSGAASGRRGRAAWLWTKLRGLAADAIGGVVFARRLLSRAHRHSGLVGFPLFWLGELTVLYGAIRAFDHRPGVVGLILAYATAHVLNSVPLPAGGSGVVEAALVSTLVVVGVPLSPAILGTFAYRVLSFWIPVLVAVTLIPVLRSLPDELEHVAATG